MSDNDSQYSGDNVHGAGHASPYPVSRLGAPISLVDTAREIESASASVALRTNAQLERVRGFEGSKIQVGAFEGLFRGSGKAPKGRFDGT